MEIEFDYGYEATEVPKIFEEAFLKDKEEALKKGEDKEHWEQDDNVIFDEWFGENYLGDYHGEIVDKEIAKFLIAKECQSDYFDGGYPREEYMIFEDNGFEYTICCFGWANEDNMKHGGYNFIGWKEKLNKSKAVTTKQ